MHKTLLDVIFASEKRMDVLTLLRDGPKGMNEILESLNTNRQALLPQMKVLINSHLINYSKDTCELTIIGKLIVDDMVPLVNTVKVFDTDIDYWGTHKFDFIPTHLLERINELREHQIINPPLQEIHDINYEFIKTSHLSKQVYVVTSHCHPAYPSLFSTLTDKNIEVHIIMSADMMDSVRNHYSEDCAKVFESEFSHFYVYPKKLDFLTFVQNDSCLLMQTLKNNGNVDNKYIFCSNKNALNWGRDLFDYYLKDSTPIARI